ncbi:MAG: amidohydrolase, partial [Chitinophagaceae bacterium]|nr:amidohydrolase [Chitinophagaceae bacterium]
SRSLPATHAGPNLTIQKKTSIACSTRLSVKEVPSSALKFTLPWGIILPITACGQFMKSVMNSDCQSFLTTVAKRYPPKSSKLNFPNRKALAHELNNPAHWGLVLEKFPNLRLNFGHFGGYETWSSSNPVPVTKDPQRRKETIFGFMEKYPNVYADFSFNLEEETIVANLKNVIVNDDLIQSRTLFGTDFWVVNPAGDLNQMQQEFLEYMERSVASLELPKKLCIDNPKRFLF